MTGTASNASKVNNLTVETAVPANAKFTDTTYSSLKNPNAITISLNGTSQGAYDGSAAKSINITASSIGAAASSHTHSNIISTSQSDNPLVWLEVS